VKEGNTGEMRGGVLEKEGLLCDAPLHKQLRGKRSQEGHDSLYQERWGVWKKGDTRKKIQVLYRGKTVKIVISGKERNHRNYLRGWGSKGSQRVKSKRVLGGRLGKAVVFGG